MNSGTYLIFPELNDYRFQAILPVPITCAGTSDKDWIIDSKPSWQKYLFQISLHYDLPLMACMMSRTPLQLVQAQYAAFLEDQVDKALMKLLTNDPILVIYDPKAEVIAYSQQTHQVLVEGHRIFEKYNMVCIAELDGVLFYEWDPMQ